MSEPQPAVPAPAERRPGAAFRVVDGILTALLSVTAIGTALGAFLLFAFPWLGGRFSELTFGLGLAATAVPFAGIVVGWIRFSRRRSAFWVVLLGILLAFGLALLIVGVIMPTIAPLQNPSIAPLTPSPTP